jgi:uncharacterized membrane protein
MECTDGLARYSFTAKRNNSISPAGWRRVFAFISAVTLGIAAGFTALGAWLVLPFAGIELALLFWAFRYLESHSGDFDRITIEGDQVTVEVLERNSQQCYEFNRYWVQVLLQGGSRLALRSRGIEVEVGRHLSIDDRVLAAKTLRERLLYSPEKNYHSGSNHDS